MTLFYLTLLAALCAGPATTLPADPLVPAVVVGKDAVKVYPTPRNGGSITVQSANNGPLSFYLFDLEGTLLYQTPLRKGERRTIGGLTKGTYVYNAFFNDEKIEGGQVSVK